MIIFLNLIAVNTGGQITRAKALLNNISYLDKNIKVVVLKNNNILNNYSNNENLTFINKNFNTGNFKAFRRMCWENIFLHKYIFKSNADIFLTFSHYLPYKKIRIPTIVGVSNLAPFSKIAIKEESILIKIKLKILKFTILNSVNKANLILALSETARNTLIKHGVESSKIFTNHIGVDKFWFDKKIISTNVLNEYNINCPFYLYVSHFYRYKNHLRLIEAF